MFNREDVDHNYYVSSFKGTTIPSADAFENAKNKAIIYFNFKVGNNQITINPNGNQDKYKDCICSLAERMYELNSQYASEGLGSWNVTYSEYSNDPKLREIMVSYLAGSGAMNVWL